MTKPHGDILTPPPPPIILLGAGPAAWSLAAACCEEGLATTVVAPDPEAAWPANYGTWVSDWEELGLPPVLGARWPRALVRTPASEQVLERAYAFVDKAALRERLRAGAAAASTVAGEATAVTENRVTLASGQVLEATVVVDCTGANSTFVTRTGSSTGAAQRAFGQLIEVDGWDEPADRAAFMDFSTETEGAVSFLYAMSLGEGRYFVEETSLAARPPVALSELRRRLGDRLTARGIQVRRVLAEEHCHIPMDPRMPLLGQPVLAFGAAASFVHPATGYTLATTLGRAPSVAAALAEGLRDKDAALARQLAWQAIWPTAARRTNQLHRLGLRVLLRLDREQTHRFFEHFFALSSQHWAQYLRPEAAPATIAQAMVHLFARAEPSLKWQLVTAGFLPLPSTETLMSGAPS